MAGWTILVYLVFTALLSPLIIFLIDRGVFSGDRLVVGNEELISWLLSPAGVFYIFLLLLLTLVGLVVRYVGLFQILTDKITGQSISVIDTALHIAPRAHRLLKLCTVTIALSIILLLPLFAGIGIVYSLYLAEFDINYYLQQTPPEWYRALTIGGIWTGLWLIITLITVGCLLPALPAYFYEEKSIKEAVLEVWYLPMSSTLRFIKVIALASLAWVTIRVLVDGSVAFAFLMILDWTQIYFEGLRALLFISGGYFFLIVSLSTIINFFGFSLISTIISRFYFSFSKPELKPEPPKFFKLTRKTMRLISWWAKPKRAAFLLIVFLIGSAVATYFIRGEADFKDDEILIITHRANVPPAPENSLAALQRSIDLNVDYAEIDVQLTADEQVVILHDEDLMRVTGVPGSVAELTYEEIRAERLLTKQNIADSLLVIPSFEEFIEAAGNYIKLMVELKYYGFNPRLAPRTIEFIRKHGIEDQVVIKSKSLRAVEQVRMLAPDLRLGYVISVSVGDLTRLDVDFLSVNHRFVTPDLIQRAENQGLEVYAWTANEREHIIGAVQTGVDGIITDYPERVIYIFDEMNRLTRAERLLLQLGLFMLDVPEKYPDIAPPLNSDNSVEQKID